MVTAIESLSEGRIEPIVAMETGNFPVSTPPKRSPKLDMALEWLRQHKADAKLSGYKLSDTVKPNGITISHVWWNKAKRLLAEEEAMK